jgi:glycosyltransferase involved in cell wall biosynthesis
MKEPLVSIKMITYNHAPFIGRAIEGVLQQKTNFPFELVIGEDCSTDGTLEIVFEYQKSHPDIIRVITSEKNVGMKKNGLRTVKACRGKYLAFCDGDDYWHHPDKMQKQVDYLENHSECGLVYSSYDVSFESSKEKISDYVKYRRYEMPENPSVEDIMQGKGVPLTCTVMLRRALYQELMEADPHLYQSDEFMMGDTQLWVEMASRARLHYIPESLATYNHREGSASRSRDKRKASLFAVSSAKLRLYLCEKYNLSPPIKDRYQEDLFETLLRLAFHTRNRELADEIRKKKRKLALEEWIRYYGAGNMVIHYIYRVLALPLNLLRKKDSQWR